MVDIKGQMTDGHFLGIEVNSRQDMFIELLFQTIRGNDKLKSI